VLINAGVNKQNGAGRKRFLRFLSSVGFARTYPSAEFPARPLFARGGPIR
jgi:hypothetical protein